MKTSIVLTRTQMTTKLTVILVGIAALALLAGMAADAAAQVPKACLEPNLSEEVQRFCDPLRFDRLADKEKQILKECLQPNLSEEGQRFCKLHFATVPDVVPPADTGQVPDECLQPNLSREVQLACDQRQFAGVPHFHVVRFAGNGAVRSVRLIATATGRELVTSYPHGVKFAIPDQLNDSEVRIRTEELEGTLAGRPTPGAAAVAPAPGFATGLAIGWNSSTGPTSGQCLNYTIARPGGNVEQASFSSQNAASSTSEQIKVSAEVNVAFDFLTAKDSFSFSDNWQSSTNSSNQYFNFYSLYTLNSTVPLGRTSQRPR